MGMVPPFFRNWVRNAFAGADGVVVAAVKHDGGGFGFQIAGGQIGPDHPPEAVREADPADVGMVAGDAVVGGGGGDQRRFAVVGDFGHRRGCWRR